MRQRLLALAGLVIAACGGPQADPGEPPGDNQGDSGVSGDGYVDALDRAEAVDDLARERQDRLEEALD